MDGGEGDKSGDKMGGFSLEGTERWPWGEEDVVGEGGGVKVAAARFPDQGRITFRSTFGWHLDETCCSTERAQYTKVIGEWNGHKSYKGVLRQRGRERINGNEKKFENFLVFSIDWDDAVEAYLFQRYSPFKNGKQGKKGHFCGGDFWCSSVLWCCNNKWKLSFCSPASLKPFPVFLCVKQQL